MRLGFILFLELISDTYKERMHTRALLTNTFSVILEWCRLMDNRLLNHKSRSFIASLEIRNCRLTLKKRLGFKQSTNSSSVREKLYSTPSVKTAFT